jgi:hypothetical protein
MKEKENTDSGTIGASPPLPSESVYTLDYKSHKLCSDPILKKDKVKGKIYYDTPEKCTAAILKNTKNQNNGLCKYGTRNPKKGDKEPVCNCYERVFAKDVNKISGTAQMKIGEFWNYPGKYIPCIKITGDGGTGEGIACEGNAKECYNQLQNNYHDASANNSGNMKIGEYWYWNNFIDDKKSPRSCIKITGDGGTGKGIACLGNKRDCYKSLVNSPSSKWEACPAQLTGPKWEACTSNIPTSTPQKWRGQLCNIPPQSGFCYGNWGKQNRSNPGGLTCSTKKTTGQIGESMFNSQLGSGNDDKYKEFYNKEEYVEYLGDVQQYLRKKMDNFGKKAKPGLKRNVRKAEEVSKAIAAPVKHKLNESGLREALKKGKKEAREFGMALAKFEKKAWKLISNAVHEIACVNGEIAAGIALGLGAVENLAECAALGGIIEGVLIVMGGGPENLAAVAAASIIASKVIIFCNFYLDAGIIYDAPKMAGDIQAWGCSRSGKAMTEKIMDTPGPSHIKTIPNFMYNSLKPEAREFAPYAPWGQYILPKATRKNMCQSASKVCNAKIWGGSVTSTERCAEKAGQLITKFIIESKLVIKSNLKLAEFIWDLKSLILNCKRAVVSYGSWSADQCIGDVQLAWCTRDEDGNDWIRTSKVKDHREQCSLGPELCKTMKSSLEKQGFKGLFK